ncbi:MAG: DUF1440 domain-containing protein [Ignavibacteria bacterium]|nr:DUF1440 domain-containing protein [Ignavibacteria bacterium]
MSNISNSKILSSGILATLSMSALAIAAPTMGMPEINVPKMLSMTMGLPMIAGWIAHFMIGIVLSFMYAGLFYKILPGPNAVKGMIFGLIPWLMAQLLVMPMMSLMNGMSFTSGLFSGSMIMAAGSLMGHLVYGLVLGVLNTPQSSFIHENSITNAGS